MTNNPTLFKLLRSTNPIIAKKMVVFIIPEGQFTPEEIEILPKEDFDRQWLGEGPFIANFLPDDIRPKGVKKL